MSKVVSLSTLHKNGSTISMTIYIFFIYSVGRRVFDWSRAVKTSELTTKTNERLLPLMVHGSLTMPSTRCASFRSSLHGSSRRRNEVRWSAFDAITIRTIPGNKQINPTRNCRSFLSRSRLINGLPSLRLAYLLFFRMLFPLREPTSTQRTHTWSR